jgi:hypothetical protein
MRTKRSVSVERNVETLVVADQKMVKNLIKKFDEN